MTPIIFFALTLDSLIHFAVPLFVVISGFVLALKQESLKEFYWKRAVRVVPAYLAASVFYALYFRRPIVGSIIHFDAAFHLYFVALIIALYILYPLIIWFYDRNPWATLAVSIILQQYWLCQYCPTLPGRFPYLIFMAELFYFVLGIHICRNYKLFKNFMSRVSLPLIIALLVPLLVANIFYYLNIYYKFSFFVNYLVELPLYLVVMMLLYKLSSNKLSWLGDHSFGIYLIHVVFLDAISNFLLPIYPVTSAVFYFFVFIFSILASTISIFMMGRVKSSWLNCKIS